MLNPTESKIDQISSDSLALDTIERYTTQNPIGLEQEVDTNEQHVISENVCNVMDKIYTEIDDYIKNQTINSSHGIYCNI